MFENVDGRTDDGRTDGRTTDAGVTGILIAHLRAFGSGELKRMQFDKYTFDLYTNLHYGKCSKISNTLKLRTPKIIAENNF